MKIGETKTWESMRTDDSRSVEAKLNDAGFDRVAAYRYNSASLRVRVIDARFDGLDSDARDAMVDPVLEGLPEEIQRDIVFLLLLAPSEVEGGGDPISSQTWVNAEFENPSPSML